MGHRTAQTSASLGSHQLPGAKHHRCQLRTAVCRAEKTTIGRTLSGVFVATLCGLLLSNVGAIPYEAAAYGVVNSYLLPLAIPLLLFSSDLKRVVADTGMLLPVFITGSLATVLSTIVAISIVPLKALGENGWKIAAALCARHIGGAINYVAVTVGLQADQAVVSAGLAADNVICALYFSVLYVLARALPAEAAAAGKDDVAQIWVSCALKVGCGDNELDRRARAKHWLRWA